MSEQESAETSTPRSTPGSDPAPTVNVTLSAMAITSLVLGIVGLMLAASPVFNLLAYIPCVLAIVFGIISIVVANGIKRRGRPLGIAGTALGLVGCAAVIVVNLTYGAFTWNMAFASAGDTFDTVDTSAAGGAAGTPEDPLAFGTTVTIGDGFVVQVGVPTEFTPTDTTYIDPGQVYFWSVDVNATNSGTETYDGALDSFDGYTDSGATCSKVLSDEFGNGWMNGFGDVLPGKTTTVTFAFQCPKAGGPELQIQTFIPTVSLFYSTAAK